MVCLYIICNTHMKPKQLLHDQTDIHNYFINTICFCFKECNYLSKFINLSTQFKALQDYCRYVEIAGEDSADCSLYSIYCSSLFLTSPP